MSHHSTRNKAPPPSHQQMVTLENFIELGKNHIINSPRSIEACLRLGLDTASLVPKTVKDYMAKDVPKFVAEIKFNHEENIRKKDLKDALGERNYIIKMTSGNAMNAMNATVGTSGHHGGHHGGISHSASAPALVLSDQDKALAQRTAAMLEQEKERLRKAKARQQAEIKSILDHETFLVQLHHQAAIREEKERERMALIEKKRAETAKAEAERKAERRAQLLEMREQEEERMRQLAAREFKESLKIAELNKKKEVEIRIHAEKRQQERLKKAEIRRMKTKKILLQLERQGDERFKKLMLADEIRKKKNEERDLLRKKKARLKREESQKRIQLAQEQAEAVLEAKRKKVFEKHRLEALKMAERKIEEEKKMNEKIKASIERDELLAERLRDIHEEERRRVMNFEQNLKAGKWYDAEVEEMFEMEHV
jgi:hypothetical protein